MSKLSIIDIQGQADGDFVLADNLLEQAKGEQAVYDVVVAYLAGLRAGTASTLVKREVSGTGAKPWRQKGTGRARAGYRQSPVWRGGGVAFGPHPRSYYQRIPRKVAELAFRHAFSEKVAAGTVRVLKALDLSAGRTKAAAAMLKALKVKRGALFIDDKIDAMTLRALRNVPGVRLTTAAEVHTYEVMVYREIFITPAAMAIITKRLAGRSSRAA